MDETEWPSIAGGEEKAEEEELKGEVMDETEWPSIAGVEEKAEEEELKGEVKDEQERPPHQVDNPLDAEDLDLMLGGLDLRESQDNETKEAASSQEKHIIHQTTTTTSNDESEGLGELRFADSD